jgi:uncharacterized metal-binding protein YceD (DUF177 family)
VSGSAAGATNEFSRILSSDRLGGPSVSESIEATEAECAAVAARLGLLAIGRLTARLTVKSVGSRLFRVAGEWQSEVTQACVVTLAPVAGSLTGEVEITYEAADERSAGGRGGEVQVDPEGDDPAEPLPDEGIDLGELVVQELAVALDPYPRAPGAEVPAEYQPPEVEEESGPFVALKVLKGDK